MAVEKANITLRLLSDKPSDVRDVYRLMKAQPSSIFIEYGACGRKIELIEKLLASNSSFAVILDDEIVGLIGYQYKPKYYVLGFDGKYWLHTLIDKKHSGKGIGPIATRLLEDFLRSSTDIVQIYSGIYAT